MGAKTGSNINSAFVLGSASSDWGTALTAGAGDKLRGSIASNFDAQELTANPIGGGAIMTPESIKGRETPTINLTCDVGYANGAEKLVAQFFGYSSEPAEQTTSQEDYEHVFTLNETANYVHGTFAYETTLENTIELPSVITRTITTSTDEADGILNLQAEILGNEVVIDSIVNTNAVLQASTIGGEELVIIKQADSFLIKEMSGGALTNDDLVSIVNYSRTITRPQDFVGNIKGSSGNAKPVINDVINGTVTVELQQLDNHDWYEAWKNGTKYKAVLLNKGVDIGTGEPFTWAEYSPCMKLVQAPEYQITDAGFNSVTLNFMLLSAGSSNPTGMTSTYPYVRVINKRSTKYIE